MPGGMGTHGGMRRSGAAPEGDGGDREPPLREVFVHGSAYATMSNCCCNDYIYIYTNPMNIYQFYRWLWAGCYKAIERHQCRGSPADRTCRAAMAARCFLLRFASRAFPPVGDDASRHHACGVASCCSTGPAAPSALFLFRKQSTDIPSFCKEPPMSRRKPVSPRPSFSRSSSRSPFLLLSRSSFRSPFLLRPAAVVLALASLPWAAHAQETVQIPSM